LIINGDNFPPPAFKAYLAQALSILKLSLIACILFGYNPFISFGLNSPGFFTWALENKLYACMMLFFVSNAMEGQLISTGAFEISLNDMPIWSKLENGRLPSPQELFQILDGQMKFSGAS